MSDKVPIQQELAKRLAELMHSFNPRVRKLYIIGFWDTMCREWTKIDNLRMDKFMSLVRQFLIHSFKSLQSTGWELGEVLSMWEVLAQGPLDHANQAKRGMFLHVTDAYLSSLIEVSSLSRDAGVTFQALEILLSPFYDLFKHSSDASLKKRVEDSVFAKIIENCMAPDSSDEEDSDDDADADTDSNQADKPDQSLFPILSTKCNYLATRFFAIASAEGTRSKNRDRLYELHTMFKGLYNDLLKAGIADEDECEEGVAGLPPVLSLVEIREEKKAKRRNQKKRKRAQREQEEMERQVAAAEARMQEEMKRMEMEEAVEDEEAAYLNGDGDGDGDGDGGDDFNMEMMNGNGNGNVEEHDESNGRSKKKQRVEHNTDVANDDDNDEEAVKETKTKKKKSKKKAKKEKAPEPEPEPVMEVEEETEDAPVVAEEEEEEVETPKKSKKKKKDKKKKKKKSSDDNDSDSAGNGVTFFTPQVKKSSVSKTGKDKKEPQTEPKQKRRLKWVLDRNKVKEFDKAKIIKAKFTIEEMLSKPSPKSIFKSPPPSKKPESKSTTSSSKKKKKKRKTTAADYF